MAKPVKKKRNRPKTESGKAGGNTPNRREMAEHMPSKAFLAALRAVAAMGKDTG